MDSIFGRELHEVLDENCEERFKGQGARGGTGIPHQLKPNDATLFFQKGIDPLRELEPIRSQDPLKGIKPEDQVYFLPNWTFHKRGWKEFDSRC